MTMKYLEEILIAGGLANRGEDIRQKLVRKYSWAIPSDDALATIRKHAPLIEIGAGKGYWASLLDVDIICFDLCLGENTYADSTKNYYPITLGGPEKLLEHPERTLFLCWPPYDDPMAADCLKVYQGDRLIFIGEGHGGCTGDSAFWEMIDDSWEAEETIPIPQWSFMHDYLTIFRREDGR